MAEKKEHADLEGMRFHKNACALTNTKLYSPDHTAMSGLCANCIMCGMCEVGLKAKTGRTLFPSPFGTAQFGAEKRLANMEDLQIMPELYGEGYFFTKVKTETTIGGFKVTVPLVIAGMGSTKVASDKNDELTIGAAKAGIPRVLGENYYITFGEEKVKETIELYKKNQKEGYGGFIVQINANEHKLGLPKLAVEFGADAIEFKIGQGAKQGMGGEIQFEGEELAEKFRKAGYEVIKKENGKYERHAFPGSLSSESLRETLKEYASYGKPLWVKTGMGVGIIKLIEELEKIKKEEDLPIELLTVDGFGGGTGMSPWLVMNEMNMPSGALFAVLKKRPSFDIILAGGYATGFDVAKAMMLGADGVAMGRPFLIAVRQPEGIEKFCKALDEELRMVAVTQKVNELSKIVGKRKALFALSKEAKDMFGITTEPKDVL
ncbi:alpha-hydroxy-acid oxidizing protein [Candidatus Woesearchaeota archaeon]|nr:alpha-hydroxy-acid oxidizing protein [Candidatus Woesearchaeota archaeon]